MKTMFYAGAAAFALTVAAMVGTALAQDPIFSAEVAAADRREHFVKVNRWGRYRFEASGADGVTLQVADKLRGVFASDGPTSGKPARVETFLEAGEYKVITEGSEDAVGSVRAAAWEYVVADAKEYLVVHKETAAELTDAGAAAWFIFVPRDTIVYIEAMGRHLGGLAVFRSSDELLVAEASARFVNDVDRQKPLNGLRIVQRLERGKHLVVAYGGGNDRYTLSDEKTPLFIQWMLQPLNPTRQLNAKIRESGVNRYSVPSSAWQWYVESDTSLNIEVHSVTPSGLQRETSFNITRGDGGYRYSGAGRFSASSGVLMITVTGKPGTEFRLSPINPSNARGAVVQNFTPPEDGQYQFRTVHTGHSQDNIGASGVLVDMSDMSIVALQADTLSESSPQLRREFNLLSGGAGITSFLQVNRRGSYRFEPERIGFAYRVSRFYVTPPRNYAPPPQYEKAADITLEEGLYVIEITPRAALGRAGFTISPSELLRNRARSSRIAAAKPRASVRFANVELASARQYRLYLNSQAPEMAAAFMEKYPAEERERVVYFIDGDAEREERTTARLPELAIGKTQYSVYDKRGLKTYRFEIGEAGIYKLETTGRLSTKLTVRNRVGAQIASAVGNGAGLNSVIAEYFLPGQYALAAETREGSAGQMGIVINRGDLAFGGQLQDWADMRATVAEFGAVVYNITVNEDGRYRFNTFGQSGMMTARLEDASGWPVFEHGSAMPREVDVRRGAYRIFSLPLTYASERVTGMRRMGNVSAGGCVDSLRGENGVLRAGMCYNFIRVEAPPQDEESSSHYEDEEEEYHYRGRRRSEPAVSMAENVVRVRVDTAGVYEIYSQGGTTVSAKLYAEDGVTMAASDAGDERNWNFVVSERLYPGTYRLNMATDRPRFPPTQVFMRRVADTLMQKAVLAGTGNGGQFAANSVVKRKLQLNGKQAVIPLEISSGDVLTLKATGGSRIACVLETQSGNHTVAIGQRQGREIRVSVPVDRETKYALKIRSLDGWSAGVVDLAVGAIESAPVRFEDALTGVSGTIEKNGPLGNEAFFRIDGVSGGPGHYELAAAGNRVVNAMGTVAVHGFFREEEESLLAASGDRLWIKAAFGSADKYDFILNPVRLADAREHRAEEAEEGGEGRPRPRRRFETSEHYRRSRNTARNQPAAYPVTVRESIPVMMRGDENKVFEIGASTSNLGLLTFTMNVGQPVAGLSTAAHGADFTRGGMFVHGGQYIDEKVCVTAIVPGDTGRIVAWNALPPPNGLMDGIHGVLTMKNYAADEKIDTLTTGRTVWRSRTPAAKEYRLESGRDRLVTAKLSPRSGVLYISPDGKRGMYYGGEGGAIHTVELNGGRMFLFGGTDEDGAAGNIELETFASKPVTPGEISAAAVFTKHFPVDTRERVRVNGRELSRNRLFWSGSIHGVDWISRSGLMTQNVSSGSALNGDNGVAFVNFAAGWSAIRLCPAADGPLETARCVWGERISGAENAPVIREMSRLPMTAGVNWYGISLGEPAHASLSAPVPSMAVTTTEGRPLGYGEYWDELSLDIPLAKGNHAVGIKPIAGRSLDGVPLTVRFYPISTLTEGDPIDIYLPPGEKRMARFDLSRKSRVGIGLRAAAETVEAALLDSAGKRLSEGRQIFAELDAGTYYVLLSTPRTSDGVDVSVRLFGQNAPPVDPPAERLEKIIGRSAGERP